MPKGGARINSGPPPDPNALRRDRPSDKEGWRLLPAKCTARPPTWPLLPDVMRRAQRAMVQEGIEDVDAALTDATGRSKSALEKKRRDLRQKLTVLDFQIAEQQKLEGQVWRELWKSPQANAWLELGWSRDVAQYVRHKVLGEMGSLDDAKEARQWSDRLGLNPAAMMRNRWRIAPDETQERREERHRGGAASKARLKAVSAVATPAG